MKTLTLTLITLSGCLSQSLVTHGLGGSLDGKVFRTLSHGGGRFYFSNIHDKSNFYSASLKGEPTDLLFFTNSTAFVSDGRNTVYSVSGFDVSGEVEAKVHCVVSPDDVIVDIARADSDPNTPWILVATNRYSQDQYAKGALWVCPTYPQKPYIQAVFTDEIVSLDTSPDRKTLYFLTKKSSQNGKSIGVYDIRQSKNLKEQDLKSIQRFSNQESQEGGKLRSDKKGNLYATWSKVNAVQSFDFSGKLIKQYFYRFKPRYLAIGGTKFTELIVSDSYEQYSSAILV